MINVTWIRVRVSDTGMDPTIRYDSSIIFGYGDTLQKWTHVWGYDFFMCNIYLIFKYFFEICKRINRKFKTQSPNL